MAWLASGPRKDSLRLYDVTKWMILFFYDTQQQFICNSNFKDMAIER